MANRDIKAFKDCQKICPKTFKLESVENSKNFAGKIKDLKENVSSENLKESRLKIMDNYSEDKILNIYEKAYKFLKN